MCSERGWLGRGGGWRAALAEAAGSALLVLLCCVPACSAGAGSGPAGAVQRALTAGFVVALIVQCFDHVSGALVNPSMTLAAVVAGRGGAALAAAQLAGAALAAGALPALVPDPTRAWQLCLTLPRDDLSSYKAACVEAVATGALCLACCASWDPRNRRLLDSWPLRIGTVVAAITLAVGELTGASLNPARSVAPALWAAHYAHQWVYWAGPLSGALLASLLYRRVWQAPSMPRAHPRGAPTPPSSPAPQRSIATTKTRCAV